MVKKKIKGPKAQKTTLTRSCRVRTLRDGETTCQQGRLDSESTAYVANNSGHTSKRLNQRHRREDGLSSARVFGIIAIEGVLEDQGDIRAWNQLVGVNLAYSQPDRRRATEGKCIG